MKKLITGNEAVALGALKAGVRCVSGYPGTPSTGALASLIPMDLKGTHVEWSTNEKVAFEIAAGVSWTGQRAMCTMKMSGVNVAYDSLAAVAYSGVIGGLVVYVADDPGVSAGCCEQDSRGFALMSDLPVLEPATVAEAYELACYAFELSEQTKSPVFLRSVTPLANSYATVDVAELPELPQAEPVLVRDIERFTKAGAVIAMNQHRDLICRLDLSEGIIRSKGLNRLSLSEQPGGLGLISAGIVSAYLDEGLELLERYGLKREELSILRVTATNPFPAKEVRALLQHSSTILVLEELEPHLERSVYVEAQKMGYQGAITGKLDGLFSRVGEYGLAQVAGGVARGMGIVLPDGLLEGVRSGEELAVPRPITVCAGCPHRGTYMAINQAIRKLRLKPEQVVVTGDIGCTILGMNPPFNTVWTEVSVG
ncbi:MAG: hypothetical protein M1281_06190, partial [Chloroflexi bacterium]|nr:hypothetical protein [Chloroflexota bacterium]